MNVPKHVAFIPDGNRRWASSRFLPSEMGHYEGGKNVIDAILLLNRYGIDNVSFYLFSHENDLKRSQQEKMYLADIAKKLCNEELKKLYGIGSRIRFLGHIPSFIDKESIKKVENDTVNNTGIQVLFYLGYSSRIEITDAVKSCVQGLKNGAPTSDNINEVLIASKLYASDIPDPDILIRTGGERRLSNFMLWQLAYTELFFVEKYWPDFSQADLDDVLVQYSKRERRYGA